MIEFTYYNAAIAAAALIAAYCVAWPIYALYFHPLAKYPGPRLAAVSNVWYALAWTSGRWPFIMEELHQKYGDVIRITPSEVVFVSPQSFRDIYNSPAKSGVGFDKDPVWYETSGPPGLSTLYDPAEHSAQKRLLAPAFSTRSLRDQEQLIHQHVDELVGKMGTLSQGERGIDTSEAFSWLTFDIAGELAFGEPFGAVREAKNHFWISLVLDGIFFFTIAGLVKRLPIVYLALPFFLPRGAAKMYKQHIELTIAKTRKRINMGNSTGRQDFFGHLLQGELTETQLNAHASIFIVAGSETTATSLTAATYFLSKHPDDFARLKEEIRGSFTSMEELTGDELARLPFLNAVIEEVLRCYPPVGFGLPRLSPGTEVDGHWIPAGYVVQTDLRLLALDERTFPDPRSFKPERWLRDDMGAKGMHGFTFSRGSYSCIGINMAYLEMRIALAKLIFKYDWDLVDPSVDLVGQSKMYALWRKPAIEVKYHARA